MISMKVLLGSVEIRLAQNCYTIYIPIRPTAWLSNHIAAEPVPRFRLCFYVRLWLQLINGRIIKSDLWPRKIFESMERATEPQPESNYFPISCFLFFFCLCASLEFGWVRYRKTTTFLEIHWSFSSTTFHSATKDFYQIKRPLGIYHIPNE